MLTCATIGAGPLRGTMFMTKGSLKDTTALEVIYKC